MPAPNDMLNARRVIPGEGPLRFKRFQSIGLPFAISPVN
jgi:hypothetical protein